MQLVRWIDLVCVQSPSATQFQVLSSTSHFPNICINCTTPGPPSLAGPPGPVGTFDFLKMIST